MFVCVTPRLRLIRPLRSFWYAVPEGLTVAIGDIVEIPWRSSFVIGVIIEIRDLSPLHVPTKPVRRVLLPSFISRTSLNFLSWFADFYAISPALAFKTLFPDIPPSLRKKNSFIVPDSPSPPAEVTIPPYSYEKKNVPILQAAIHFLHSPSKPVLIRYVKESDKLAFYYTVFKNYPEKTLLICPTKAAAQKLVAEFFWLKPVFFHADMTAKEMWDRFYSAHTSEAPLIIGTKSALAFVFAQTVKTVIVDDDDSSHHRNYDQNPRYLVQDALFEAFKKLFPRFILTARVPRITSAFACQSFFFPAPLSKVTLLNLEEERLGKRLSIISEPLLAAVQKSKKFFFFVNRIGYARYLICRTCHRFYASLDLSHCTICRSSDLREAGFGTEKFLETLRVHFPNRSVVILDRNHIEIPKEYDILVATEKSFGVVDFSVFDAGAVWHVDSLIAHLSWRSSESAFALLLRLRCSLPHLFLQSFFPDSEVLQRMLHNDYPAFFQKVLDERKIFSYPPYGHIALLLRGGKTYKTLALKNVSWASMNLPTDSVIDLDPDNLS